MLVSWTRVLSGKFWDPVVGRDVLVGCGFGIVLWVLLELAGGGTPLTLTNAMGVGWFTAALMTAAGVAPFSSMIFLSMLSFLRALLRKNLLTALAMIFVISVPVVLGVVISPDTGL